MSTFYRIIIICHNVAMKTVVLDTNVLLTDASALHAYPKAIVVIPETVVSSDLAGGNTEDAPKEIVGNVVNVSA